MSQENLELQFLERIRTLLVSLPYDMKVLFEAMTDEDLPRDARILAAGAAVYCISPSDPLPDSMGLVGFVDDVVIVRLGLKKLLEIGGDEVADYPDRFQEQFSRLDEDVELVRAYLGDALDWVDRRIDKLGEAKFKGKSIATYVDDYDIGQRLYEDGLEFTTDYEIDDDAAARLISGKPVLEAFANRSEVERSRIGR